MENCAIGAKGKGFVSGPRRFEKINFNEKLMNTFLFIKILNRNGT